MLRRIFTFKVSILVLASFFVFIVYSQDVDSNTIIIAMILTVNALMLSEITRQLEKIHQLLLLQSESVVEQAVASLNGQRDGDLS